MIFLVLLAVLSVVAAIASGVLLVHAWHQEKAARAEALAQPLDLTPNAQGNDLSWNDLVVYRLRAHYGDTNHNLSINDLLRKWQQDHGG